MSLPSETGRFWLCPECSKHVPARTDACMCGFDRTKVPVQMREVSSQQVVLATRERSFSSSVLPVLVIALLLGYIGYDKLGWGTAAPEVVPTPAATPLTEPAATVTIRDERAHDPVGRRAPPVVQQPRMVVPQQQPQQEQVIRVEVPQQQQTVTAPRENQQQELYWRGEARHTEARLIQAKEMFRAALCREKIAGIPMASGGTGSGYLESRGTYMATRAEAGAFQESARRAGAQPRWYEINMREFPAPPMGDVLNMTTNEWGCEGV